MTDQLPGSAAPTPPAPRAAGPRLLRALYTHNPFYVISADLIFIGLRMSFDPTAKAFDTWALIAGLVGFTLLLAVTACLLVRFGRVWDDMRSVLLLVVMMFLAISTTIDDVLIPRPGVGLALAAGGLAFAVLVSEGLLRGMRLWLPALYRGPYYLILALFFVYPVALRPLLARPDDPASHWAIFGFATVAGLAFLTLIPAIRRGGAYVKGNGSPWRWPLYPWSLFFFLGLGVCARAYYLSISLHNVEGYRSIFGPYFLVPFGFAIALLLLEGGLASGRAGVVRVALAMPFGLLGLAMVGHRPDPVYGRFLGLFRDGLGVAPPAATLILAVAFLGSAAARSVPRARGLALAALALLSVVGPGTLDPASLEGPRAWPLLVVGAILAGIAIRRGELRRGVVAAACLGAGLVLLPGDAWTVDRKVVALLHLILVAQLVLGAALRDRDGSTLGEQLRFLGALELGLVAALAAAGEPHLGAGIPAAILPIYPALVATVALAYGLLVGVPAHLAVAGAILGGMALVAGARWYAQARLQVVGLDRIAAGLASFLVATLISLGKAGLPRRWREARARPPGPGPCPIPARAEPR